MDADVIVIGSGQAGVPLATRLARAGKRVLLVERALLGGTCSNYGCTPTKTMVASARAAHVARTAARLGVQVGEVRVDLSQVVARKDAIVGRWRDGVERKLAQAGERLRLVRGAARFVGEREIEAAGERHRASTIVINVGARADVPRLPGLAEVPWLDNRRLMELRQLPRRLLVLGGGYIGCEFAQMFRRFGAEVLISGRGRHLLPREDPDVSMALESVFRKEGIELRLGLEVERVSQAGGEIVLDGGGEALRGSHLLVAVGRRPNTDDLGCEAAGIALDRSGYVTVDDGYRTSVRGVYAVGDCAGGGTQFTHTAWDDHRLLYDLLEQRGTRGRSARLVPSCVFTDPQVARVGLTEREARARGLPFEVATLPAGDVARAIEVDETAGVMKVLLDPKSERVIGASLVGPEAGELIHVFVALMQARASARAIVDAEFVHPTFAEGVQSLVMALGRYTLS